MMRLLALDFDGVISDSAPESFVVALRTFCELRPGTALGDTRIALSGPAPAPDEIEGDRLYAPFIGMMALGNRAEDYAVELSALESGVEIHDQAGYDRYKVSLDAEWLRTFHRRFYRVRAEMSEQGGAAWLRLMGAYPGMPELLRRRSADVVLAIATSKDRRSVSRLLEAYGVASLFPEGRILDKDKGVTKRTHLEYLQQRFGFDFEDITFVDDKVNHLDTAAPLGVRCGLASWGYNSEREISTSRSRGYLVLELGDVESALFGGSS